MPDSNLSIEERMVVAGLCSATGEMQRAVHRILTELAIVCCTHPDASRHTNNFTLHDFHKMIFSFQRDTVHKVYQWAMTCSHLGYCPVGQNEMEEALRFALFAKDKSGAMEGMLSNIMPRYSPQGSEILYVYLEILKERAGYFYSSVVEHMENLELDFPEVYY